jgi:hypothetical protein
MTASIKETIAKKIPKVKQGFTLQSLMAAFNSGLGIRKVSWTPGYFVYLKDGVVMNGSLLDRNRDDKPKTEEFTFGNDMSVWEIVDANYVKKIDLLKKIEGLHNIKDGALIARLANVAKITLP